MIVRLWVALAAVLLAWSPAEAAWKRAESPNFILYGEQSEADLREQAALLEDYHDFLRSLTGVTDPPPANKLNVYLVRGRGQLRAVKDVGPNVAGFYTATGAGIGAFADAKVNGDDILLHEIAHHFMMQYRPLPYPAWYVEGFAEYVMTSEFKKDVIEFGRPNPNRITWLARVRWLPYDRVLFGGVPREDKEASALFYAQSWLLVHYLLRDAEQRPKVTRYMSEIVKGVEPRKAFAEAFAMTPKQLEEALRSYARRGMTYTTRKRSSAAATPPVKITQLSPGADELLLLKASMDIRNERDRGANVLARVRTEAAKHPGDPFAQRVLAQAEALYGDGAKAETLLDALLVSSPSDVELLYLKGMRHLVAARAGGSGREAAFKEARKWFVQAHKADANHYQTLLRYAESLGGDRRFASDNTINILLLAQELAPQVQETAINAGGLLMTRGRFEEAERLLAPLAADPHDSGLALAARSLLALAKARKKPGEGAQSSTAREVAKE
jgi:Flp pilus assembly protein TadD